MKYLQLRIKDVDSERNIFVVRDGKGDRDHVVMLPGPIAESLNDQIYSLPVPWEADRDQQVPGVWLPDARERKCPRAGAS